MIDVTVLLRLRQLVLARDDASPSLRLTVLLELTRTLLDGGLETGGIATAKAFAELVPRLYGEDTDMEINWLDQMASSLHQQDRDRMALKFTRSMIEAAGQASFWAEASNPTPWARGLRPNAVGPRYA